MICVAEPEGNDAGLKNNHLTQVWPGVIVELGQPKGSETRHQIFAKEAIVGQIHR